MDLVTLYLWLAAVTGARRGELCGLQWDDTDLDAGVVHVAFSYVVPSGQKLRKGTKTHQERHLAIDPLGATAWNPDWVTHKVAEIAEAAGIKLNIKALRCAPTTSWPPGWRSAPGTRACYRLSRRPPSTALRLSDPTALIMVMRRCVVVKSGRIEGGRSQRIVQTARSLGKAAGA